MRDKRKNAFISHYNKHDDHIKKLKDLLQRNGYNIRNSSIDSTKPNQANSPDYIRSLLRSRINWAGTTIVLIGPQTHTREWVNWEIEQSNKAGNLIVGIYIRGSSDCKVPDAFNKYGDALVGWNSDCIIDAIEGRCSDFNKPDGSPRDCMWKNTSGACS